MKLKKGTLLFLLLTCLTYTTLAQTDYELQGSDVTINENGIITACSYDFNANKATGGTNLTIPKSVTKDSEIIIKGIGDNAFNDKSLVAVVFEEGSEVTTIGASAFQNNQITALTLPTTLASIGADAFSGNTGLTITLPEHAKGADVTYKDSNDQEYDPNDENKNTFTNFDRSLAIEIPPSYTLQAGDVTVVDGIITECLRCEDFDNKRIIIPVQIGTETITGIDDTSPGVFQDKNLISVKFADNSKVTTIGGHAFRTNQITELSLPSTLTTIESWAFQNNQITTLTFPDDAQLTTIGGYAFLQNKITTLDLPEGLTTIEFSAFENNQITELSLPTTLITIGEWAFYQNQITEPTLPTALTTIGEYAFRDNRITSLTFPENAQLTTIGKEAFLGNEDDGGNQITELTLPTALTTIGESAFGNNKITTLTFPENAQLTTIGKEAFLGNEDDGGNQITELTLPTALTTIGESAFGNNKITTLTFPENAQLTTIGGWAFRGNEGDGGNKITTLALPPSLTVIGDSAFYNNSLTSVTFNDNPNKSQIKSIGNNVFSGNTGLMSITLPEHAEGTGVTYEDSNDQVYEPGDTFTDFDRSLVMLYTLQEGDVTVVGGIITECHCEEFVSKRILIPKQIGETTITGIANQDPGIFEGQNLVSVKFADGSEVTTIGNAAFSFNKITEFTPPASLKTIGSEAFYNNYITELTFPNDAQLETIGGNAFQGNDGEDAGGNKITTLALPPSLTVIGDSAFYNNSLTSVTFNDNPNKSQIKSIGNNVFSGNTGLMSITLPEHAEGTGVTYEDSNDQVYEPGDTFTDFDRSLVMLYTLQEDDVTVVDGIITECHCEKFVSKRIIIPVQIGTETITGIANQNPDPGIFEGQNLVSVKFADGSEVTTIGDNTFRSNSITELSLPTTVTIIRNAAFSFNKITELTLPASLKTIGNAAFSFNKITELTLPASLTTIGNSAFYSNDITELTLPASLTTIGESAFSFNKITELTLPTTLKTIGNAVFASNQITTLSLPPSLETIGESAFDGNNITELTFPVDSQLKRIGESAFLGNEDDGGNQITTLSLPPSLETIRTYAFWNNSLTTVTFNDDPNKSRIKNIEKNAFSENTGLTGITLPNHVGGDVTYEDIDDENNSNQVYNPGEVFKNFGRSLVAVIPPHILTADDVDIDDKGIITKCHCGNFVSNSIEIPVQIGGKPIRGIVDKSWPDGIFQDKNLIAVVFADGSQITDIGENAFSTNQITEITLPTTLTTIGDFAFSFNKITELTLPTALTTIGKWAFYGNKITELPFPEDSQLTSIGESAFFGNQLDSFTLPMATKEGFRTYWKDGNSVDLETNLTIPEADFEKSFELVFIEQVTLTVEVNNEEGGSIEPSDDHFAIDKAEAPSTQELTATPADGWRFDKWVITSGEDEDGNPITETVDVVGVEVTVDVNKTVTAHFVQQVTLTLTIEETGASNVVSGLNAGKNKIDKGVDFKLEAMPASGQRFVSWTIDGKTIEYNPHTLTTIEADISITVTFEAIPQQVTLTLAIEGEGSINPLVKPNSVDPDNEMKGMYDIKTKVTLTAKPNDGWRFDKWVIGSEDITDNPTTITLDKNKSVTAHFVEEEEAITSILTEVVSANPYPNPVTSQITLKAKDGDLIQLFSPKGKQQYSTQHTGNEAHTIDVSTIPVGVYLVRITDAEGNTTTKRIVKK